MDDKLREQGLLWLFLSVIGLAVVWPWKKLYRTGFEQLVKYLFWILLLVIMGETIYLLHLVALHQQNLVQAWEIFK